MKKLLSAIISVAIAAVLAINIAAAVPTTLQIPPTDLSAPPAAPNAETLAKATDYAGTHFYDDSEVIDKLTALGYEAEQKLRVPPLQPDIALMGSMTYMIEVRKDDILCARIYYYIWDEWTSPTGWDFEMGFCAVYDTDLFSTGFDFVTSDTDEQAIEKAAAQGFRQGSGHDLGEQLPHDLQFTNGEFNVELAREGDLTVYVVEKHLCESYGTIEGSFGYNDFAHWEESDCWCHRKKAEQHYSRESGEQMICDKCGEYFSGVYLAELIGKSYDEVKEAFGKSVGEEYLECRENYSIVANPTSQSMGWQYINIRAEFETDFSTGECRAYRITLRLPDGHPVTSEGLTYRTTYGEIKSYAEKTGEQVYLDEYVDYYGDTRRAVYLKNAGGAYYKFIFSGREGFNDDSSVTFEEANTRYTGETLPDLSGECLEDMIGKPASVLYEFADRYPFFASAEETVLYGSKGVIVHIGDIQINAQFINENQSGEMIQRLRISYDRYNSPEDFNVTSNNLKFDVTFSDIKNSGLEYRIGDNGYIGVKTKSGAYAKYYNRKTSEELNDDSVLSIDELSLFYTDNTPIDLSGISLSDFLGKDYSYLEEFAFNKDYSFYSVILDTTPDYMLQNNNCREYRLQINSHVFTLDTDNNRKINIVYFDSDGDRSLRPKAASDFPYSSMTVGEFLDLIDSGKYEYEVTEYNYDDIIEGASSWSYNVYTETAKLAIRFGNYSFTYSPETGSVPYLMSDEEFKSVNVYFDIVASLPYTKGDVNGDGEATLDDAIKTLQASMQVDIGSDTFIEQAADLTGDGNITLEDAIEILKIAMKVEK